MLIRMTLTPFGETDRLHLEVLAADSWGERWGKEALQAMTK